MEVGSDHHSPLKVLSRFFWARTEYSTTSTLALTPTSFHMAAIASDIGLVAGHVADRGLDDDLLVLVARPSSAARAPPSGRTASGGSDGVEVVVALGDRPVGHDAAAAPQLLHDGLAVDGERQRLLDERVVERRALGVDAEDVEARRRARRRRASWRCRLTRSPWSGGSCVITSTSPLSSAATRGAVSGIGRARSRGRRRSCRPSSPGWPRSTALSSFDPRDEAHRPGADRLGVEGVAARPPRRTSSARSGRRRRPGGPAAAGPASWCG